MEHDIRAFASLPSTNLYAKQNLPQLKDGEVIWAKEQTQGRGRLGRKWDGEEGALCFSLVLKSFPTPELLPLLTGVALAWSSEGYGLSPLLKWPNDLILGSKKAAGILVEGVYEAPCRAYVVGVGVNLSQKAFPTTLPNATSFYLQGKGSIDPSSFLESFLAQFDRAMEEQSSALAYLRSHDFLLDQEITLDYYGEGIHGKEVGIDGQGKLLLQKDDGSIQTISSGEASLLRKR